ncbi:MAG: glycosyltransferase family 2 protein [Solirubrobacterales bacterium]|nr:glycosyltransferase family 2 protein [Solirubrobacterales bacterium]
MKPLLHDALVCLQVAVLVYFVMCNAFLLLLLASSALSMARHRLEAWHEGRLRLLGSEAAPRISLVAPAFNEALTVSQSVRSLLTLSYPQLEVVLVNDGSSDSTIDVLRRDFDLVQVKTVYRRRLHAAPVRAIYRSTTSSGLVVVDKDNGGKADALNAGLNVATGELVCAIDADTVIEPDGLLRMVRPFLLHDGVVAAGGTIRAANGCTIRGGRVIAARAPRGLLAGIQAVEYERAFLAGRLGWNRLGGNLIVSGAFGLFRREATIAAGGYEHATVGEDMELVARLRRHARDRGLPDRVEFIPDPVAWTEVPESLRGLGRQRDRWHRGLADVLWRHRAAIGRPRYGTLGLVALPYFLLVELFGPVVEAAGLVGLVAGLLTGTLSWPFSVLFFLAAYALGLVVTVFALVLDECTYRGYGGLRERLRLFGFALLEPFGYRQLTTLWRLRGLVKFLRGRTDWGEMTRTGFTVEPDAPAVPPGPPAVRRVAGGTSPA